MHYMKMLKYWLPLRRRVYVQESLSIHTFRIGLQKHTCILTILCTAEGMEHGKMELLSVADIDLINNV